MFYMQSPSRCGMSLQDALQGRFMNLRDRDDHMFEQRGPSVSIRLMVCLEHVVLTTAVKWCTVEADFDSSVARICSLEQANTDKGLPNTAAAHNTVQASQECREDSSTLHHGKRLIAYSFCRYSEYRVCQDMEKRPMEDDADVRWRVGSGYIQLQDLALVGLQHVSMGSWQAYVVLRR